MRGNAANHPRQEASAGPWLQPFVAGISLPSGLDLISEAAIPLSPPHHSQFWLAASSHFPLKTRLIAHHQRTCLSMLRWWRGWSEAVVDAPSPLNSALIHKSVNCINPLKTVELLLCKTRVSDGLSRPRVGSAGPRWIWYETISCRWYRNLVFWKYRFCLEIFLYILDLSNW